ncbi:hypothetical protein [Caenispirillum bisanense]|uniref:hypothetical protein n=1 Tax=Caenispirillum bisanense TaxID=414052 RepID=UPI0031D60464
MWSYARNRRAEAWLDIQHPEMTAATVRAVTQRLAQCRRNLRRDGGVPEPGLYDVADAIICAAIAHVRAAQRGERPAFGIHRDVLAACPDLHALFLATDDWAGMAAQLVGGGAEPQPDLTGKVHRYPGSDQRLATPPARGRWGAVRQWRQRGAMLLGSI